MMCSVHIIIYNYMWSTTFFAATVEVLQVFENDLQLASWVLFAIKCHDNIRLGFIYSNGERSGDVLVSGIQPVFSTSVFNYIVFNQCFQLVNSTKLYSTSVFN